MSQTAQHPRFAIPKEIRLASQSDGDDVWSWRAALLLMLSWCLLAWIGIGLLIAGMID